jgi:aerotaxis receptor
MLFEELSKAAASLLEQANGVYENYARHRNVPLNLRIQAARLGPAGAMLAVISMSYDALSTAINTMMAQFIVSAKQLFSAINKGLFLCGAALIQKEMCTLFKAECSAADDLAPSNEITLLEQEQRSSADGLRAIAHEAERFDRFCSDLKRAASGLETTYIMGKVECARIENADAGLSDLLGDLENYQMTMAQGVQKMLAISQSIQRDVLDLVSGAASWAA